MWVFLGEWGVLFWWFALPILGWMWLLSAGFMGAQVAGLWAQGNGSLGGVRGFLAGLLMVAAFLVGTGAAFRFLDGISPIATHGWWFAFWDALFYGGAMIVTRLLVSWIARLLSRGRIEGRHSRIPVLLGFAPGGHVDGAEQYRTALRYQNRAQWLYHMRHPEAPEEGELAALDKEVERASQNLMNADKSDLYYWFPDYDPKYAHRQKRTEKPAWKRRDYLVSLDDDVAPDWQRWKAFRHVVGGYVAMLVFSPFLALWSVASLRNGLQSWSDYSVAAGNGVLFSPAQIAWVARWYVRLNHPIRWAAVDRVGREVYTLYSQASTIFSGASQPWWHWALLPVFGAVVVAGVRVMFLTMAWPRWVHSMLADPWGTMRGDRHSRDMALAAPRIFGKPPLEVIGISKREQSERGAYGIRANSPRWEMQSEDGTWERFQEIIRD